MRRSGAREMNRTKKEGKMLFPSLFPARASRPRCSPRPPRSTRAGGGRAAAIKELARAGAPRSSSTRSATAFQRRFRAPNESPLPLFLSLATPLRSSSLVVDLFFLTRVLVPASFLVKIKTHRS